ncbi:hypothetical protein [Flindersiella endophytica]
MTAHLSSRPSIARYVAGYAGVACASVYIGFKALWIAGVPFGLDATTLDREGMVAGNVLTAGLAVAGVLVLLAFTHGKGRRLPAWLVLVPTWVGTGLLAPIAIVMVTLSVLAFAGVYHWPVVEGAAPWLHGVVYSCFSGLGICLAIVFGLHVHERWPALFESARPVQSPTRPVQLPLAWAGLAIATLLGLLRLYWAAGGTAGLVAANLHRRELPWHLLHLVSGALTLAAVGGTLLLFYRPARRLRIALPLLWVGSGGLFASGLVEFGLSLVSGPVTAAWQNPEAPQAYNGMLFGALLGGVALGFAALLAGVDRVYSSRWTVSGENAGKQTATYSAPSGPGVE